MWGSRLSRSGGRWHRHLSSSRSSSSQFDVLVQLQHPDFLRLPLPTKCGLSSVELQRLDEEEGCVRPLTVGQLKSRLSQLDAGLKTIEFRRTDDQSLIANHSPPIFPCTLQLNQLQIRLMPSVDAEDDSYAADLNKESARFLRLKAILEKDIRRQIPMEEYIKLCKNVGANEDIAKEWLLELQRRDVLIHFDQSKDKVLQDRIILRPMDSKNVAKLTKCLDMDFVKHNYELESSLKRMTDLVQERKKVQNHEEHLKIIAGRKPTVYKWASLLGLSSLYSGLAYTVWDVYSWDVMEPITYFIGFTAILGSSFYHTMTKHDATYTNIWARSYNKNLNKIFVANKYNPSALKRLNDDIFGLQNQINAIKCRVQSKDN